MSSQLEATGRSRSSGFLMPVILTRPKRPLNRSRKASEFLLVMPRPDGGFSSASRMFLNHKLLHLHARHALQSDDRVAQVERPQGAGVSICYDMSSQEESMKT